MATNGEDVRRQAIAELARRELARRQSQARPFVGPTEDMAPKTSATMRKLGLLDAVRATSGPAGRAGIGMGEAALSIGTGMVSAPLNSAWNAAMEAGELPTGQPVGTYAPRSPEGQAIVGGVANIMSPVTERLDQWTGLNDPDPAVRATGNLMNAVAGIAPGVGPVRAARSRRAAIPTRDEIKGASQALYESARGTGEMLPQSGFSGLIQRAETMLANESFDATQHPRTAAALNRLYEEGTRPGIQGFSPQGAEVVRRHLMNAEESAVGDIKNPAQGTSADARLAAKLLDDFDDFMEAELAKAGPQYQQARALWRAQLKSAEIERLFERAKNQAGQYSVSGMDNALRSQFRSLADNPRRFNRFSAQEKEAILRVARGDMPQNWLQRMGKFSISRGGVAAVPTLLGTAIDPTLGAILAIGGEAARVGSGALRSSRARGVDQLVRAGAMPAMPQSRLRIPRTENHLGILPAGTLAVDEAGNALLPPEDRPRNALTRR